MYNNFNFPDILATSGKASWQLEDVLPPGAALDFGRPFMPEALARSADIGFLTYAERRLLNQIRGHEYLSIFGLVEEFILPFVLDHARPQLSGDDHRARALLQFAGEEAKHIHLFKQFHQRFTEDFGVPCQVIGPAEEIGAFVLGHETLSVALLVLHIEWMSQRHYLESIRDAAGLDPLFKSLLKHHWMEEAQHAKLDTIMVETLAERMDAAAIRSAVDGYLLLVNFFDEGLRQQAAFNLDALESVIGGALPHEQREQLLSQQHQALRWTYLGSGMTHPNFAATLAAVCPVGGERIAAIAPAFC